MTGAVATANGATLSAGTDSGTGKVNVVGASSTLLPATGTTNTIGTLTTGNLALGASTGTSGNLAIKVSDAASSGNPGTAGTNYDTVVAQTISVPSNSPMLPASPFNVQLLGYGTLSSPVANSASVNFNSNATYVWQIASYTSTTIPGTGDGTTEVLTNGGGLTAPSAVSGLFSLDTSGFASANSIPGGQQGILSGRRRNHRRRRNAGRGLQRHPRTRDGGAGSRRRRSDARSPSATPRSGSEGRNAGPVARRSGRDGGIRSGAYSHRPSGALPHS